MASFANVTLNTKVYTPSSYNNGVAGWLNRDAGVAAGFSPLTQRVYQAPRHKDGSLGAWHSVHKLTVPIVAETDSSCSCSGSVLRESGFDIHGWFAAGATLSERTDLYDRLCSLVLTDQFKETFTKLEPVHS